jgi:hypothetical protein
MRTLVLRLALVLAISQAAPASRLTAQSPQAPAPGGAVESRIVWVDGKPAVDVTAEGPEAPGLGPLEAPIELFDAAQALLWGAKVKLEQAPDKRWKGRLALEKIADPKKQHRLELRLRSGPLGIEYKERIFFGPEVSKIQTYGLRSLGIFPRLKETLTIGLGAFPPKELQEIPLSIKIQDADGNVVADRQTPLRPRVEPSLHQVDVTPAASGAVGPFSLDAGLDSDVHGISFSISQRFAHPNALVPLSSMEHGDPTLWFASSEGNPNYRSLQYYYCPHINSLVPPRSPGIRYDREMKHSGQQSLRIDYESGKEAVCWGRQELPGKPTALTLWVHGNESNDQLIVYFEDHINLALAAWDRNANFSQVNLGPLNYTGWRLFRAPVLGEGMQVSGLKGSTVEIDAPIRIMAFAIVPGERPKGAKPPQDPRTESRSVWIDDLSVETQAAPAELLSLELRPSDRDAALTAEGSLAISVGNGLGAELKRGQLSLLARDGAGEVVWTRTSDLPAPAEGFVTTEVPLKELEGKKPRGPVDLDVAFFDPTRAGTRVVRRIVLKAAREGGIFFDFEEPQTYSGYRPGGVVPSNARIVEGGEGGSKHALALVVSPELVEKPEDKQKKRGEKREAREDSSVLFHPALPGIVDRVEMMVKGGERPVVLQPWFIDDGRSGIWNRPYNMFWPEPVTVEGSEWRKIVIPAPPISPFYAEKGRTFLFTPAYPLNFALSARLKDGGGTEPVEIRIDNVRVITHLDARERIQMEVDYPDETRIHSPGAPLGLVVRNLSGTEASFDLAYELRSYQGEVTSQGKAGVRLGTGQKGKVQLVAALSPGIYDLVVRGPDGLALQGCILVLGAQAYFDSDPAKTLRSLPTLKEKLHLQKERIYLDWDNAEPAPYLFHFNWFEQELEKLRKEAGAGVSPVPVVGFSADWAGPEALDSIRKGQYRRSFVNQIQVPRRLIDWSLFIRETLREYKGRFGAWTFWENPDLEEAPQNIPPEKYGPMLEAFHRWVKLYDPKATVVAGGFNFNKALSYLEKIREPQALKFDEIAVQMNLAELSPERAEVENFLDELGALLGIDGKKKTVRVTELDWPIGEHLTTREQAAYHARAAMILHSRGVPPHEFSPINTGFAFEGNGVVYRLPYGNSTTIRHENFLPAHVPKPAYFALAEIGKFLAEWTFVTNVDLPDRSLSDNRAFVYKNKDGRLAVAVWRAVAGDQRFGLPKAWTGAQARDVFGFPVKLDGGLRSTALPTILTLPPGMAPGDLIHDLRTLQPAGGGPSVLLDLHLGEEESRRRASCESTGKTSLEVRAGILPGDRMIREPFMFGLETEKFVFKAERAGRALLRRRWHFEGAGQKLTVVLNGGREEPWDLAASPGIRAEPGVRESTFVLENCKAGENRVEIRGAGPGNSAGCRVEELPDGPIPLERWGLFGSAQTRGRVLKSASAVGTPLTIGGNSYPSGLGAHAISFMEVPLGGRFEAFEVTVGVDGSTEGRGSVVFQIYVDGKERATSGLMTGLSKPKVLRVDQLGQARRMILSVQDGGDGNRNDLADWVDGKLFLKRE